VRSLTRASPGLVTAGASVRGGGGREMAVWLGGLWPEGTPGFCRQAVAGHEPGDPVLRTGVTPFPQFHRHAGTAVTASVAVFVDAFHLFEEDLILGPARSALAPAPLVIGAPRELEGLAEFGNGLVFPHRVNQRIPACGSSARMLAAFLGSRAGEGDARSPGEAAGSPRPSARGPLRPGPRPAHAGLDLALRSPEQRLLPAPQAIGRGPEIFGAPLRDRPLLT